MAWTDDVNGLTSHHKTGTKTKLCSEFNNAIIEDGEQDFPVDFSHCDWFTVRKQKAQSLCLPLKNPRFVRKGSVT